MDTQEKSKDRLRGKRLFVYQAGRGGYTTISIAQAQYEQLLGLAHLDEHTLRDCARFVSWHGRAVSGQPWSTTVANAMFAKLRWNHNPDRLAAAREVQAKEVELAHQAAEKVKAQKAAAAATLLPTAEEAAKANKPMAT